MDWYRQRAKDKERRDTILSPEPTNLSIGSFLRKEEAVPWTMAWRRLTHGEDLDMHSALANAPPRNNLIVPASSRKAKGPIAAPGLMHQKKDHPKIFLAVDRPFYLAMYTVLLEGLGCIVEGSTNLLYAPNRVSPKQRSIHEPNKYDLVIYEKLLETSPESDIADFTMAVKANDREFRQRTNFIANTTIIHLVGENENGSMSLVKGANLFLRRPFVVHLPRIRELLLPEQIRATSRCRAFNKRAGYHRMLELMEQDPAEDDEDVLRDRYNQDVTLTLPITQDHDQEETELLKKGAALANRENHRLHKEVKELTARCEVAENAVKTQTGDLERALGVMTTERDKVEQERADLEQQLNYMTGRLERAEEVEKARATTVKDSEEVKEAMQAEQRAKLRINHLVSELEKERRMNAHRARGVVRVGGNGTSVAVQAGSGVTLFYRDQKKETGTQCEIITEDQLTRLKVAQQEAAKMVEDMLKADQERAVERRPSVSVRSQNRKESMQSGTATVQDFLDQSEITSLKNRVKSLEAALEAARAKVTSHHSKIKEQMVEIEILKGCKNDLQELFATSENCTTDERLAAVVSTNDSLSTMVHQLQQQVQGLVEEALAKGKSTKYRERCFRVVLALGSERFAATTPPSRGARKQSINSTLDTTRASARGLLPFGSPEGTNFESNSEEASLGSEVAQRNQTGIFGPVTGGGIRSSSRRPSSIPTPGSASTNSVKPLTGGLSSSTPMPFGK